MMIFFRNNAFEREPSAVFYICCICQSQLQKMTEFGRMLAIENSKNLNVKLAEIPNPNNTILFAGLSSLCNSEKKNVWYPIVETEKSNLLKLLDINPRVPLQFSKEALTYPYQILQCIFILLIILNFDLF